MDDDAVKPLPHSRYPHVFVILRVDRYLRTDDPQEAVKVKKVVADQLYAEREVDRLNALNQDKNSEYYWESAQFDTTDAPHLGGQPGHA
jgi:hypothetical protein